VVGGSSLPESPRATLDINLVVALQAWHARPLGEALRAHYYRDDATALQAIQSGTSFNAVHLATAIKIDDRIRHASRPNNMTHLPVRIPLS